jgi:hypothetical protein
MFLLKNTFAPREVGPSEGQVLAGGHQDELHIQDRFMRRPFEFVGYAGRGQRPHG